MLLWMDYESKYAQLVDIWLDEEARAMTGIDDGWDPYWNAVREDAVNYPGCADFCKIICEDSVPFAAVCFGVYRQTMTVSEIVLDPKFRGRGKGSRVLRELVEQAGKKQYGDVKRITAVVFPKNFASRKMFLNAGFCFEKTTEDGVDLIFSLTL